MAEARRRLTPEEFAEIGEPTPAPERFRAQVCPPFADGPIRIMAEEMAPWVSDSLRERLAVLCIGWAAADGRERRSIEPERWSRERIGGTFMLPCRSPRRAALLAEYAALQEADRKREGLADALAASASRNRKEAAPAAVETPDGYADAFPSAQTA